jgi:hypothetical protein
MLRKIFGQKMVIMGGRRRVHNKENHKLHSSVNSTWRIKSKRMTFVGMWHVGEEKCKQISCRVTWRQETNIKNSDGCKLAKNSDGKKVVLNRYSADVGSSFSFTKMLNTQQV